MITNRIIFPVKDLHLEGISHLPDGQGPFSAVVVSHPHPLYGGDMNNNIVMAVCEALSNVSIASVRFNFRGVGGSQGNHARGIGEQDDVLSALSFLSNLECIEPDRIGLCGYSFGANMSMYAASGNEYVKALALISPVISQSSPLQHFAGPELILWGSEDHMVPTVNIASQINKPGGSLKCEVISGADHFWGGYEDIVATKIAAFFADTLL